MVEDPDLQLAESLGIATADHIGSQQRILLDGDGETSGLTSAVLSLNDRDLQAGCTTIGSILMRVLVDEVLLSDGSDASRFSDDMIQTHDPQRLFLGRSDAKVYWFQSHGQLEVDVEPNVVSAVWKDVTLALIDLVYALGEECIGAAEAGADQQ